METRPGRLIFSTGKEVYCNAETVGFCLFQGAHGNITYGYDGDIPTVVDRGYNPEFDEENEALTKEESAELARHMIKAWEGFLLSVK